MQQNSELLLKDRIEVFEIFDLNRRNVELIINDIVASGGKIICAYKAPRWTPAGEIQVLNIVIDTRDINGEV